MDYEFVAADCIVAADVALACQYVARIIIIVCLSRQILICDSGLLAHSNGLRICRNRLQFVAAGGQFVDCHFVATDCKFVAEHRNLSHRNNGLLIL